MNWQMQIGVAGVVTVLIIWLLHWFPWRLLIRQDLPRLGAYTLGILAIGAPYSVLLLVWDINTISDLIYRILVAFWALVAVCGLATISAYVLDHLMDRLNKTKELEQLLELKDEQFGKIRDRS